MNRLRLELVWGVITEGEAANLGVALWVDDRLWADGTEITADLPELRDSIEQDGCCFPISCNCGDWGCGGWLKPLVVSHAGPTVRWNLPTDFYGSFSYTFDATEYCEVIKRAIEEGRRLAEPHRDRKWLIIPQQNSRLLFDMEHVDWPDFMSEYWPDTSIPQ